MHLSHVDMPLVISSNHMALIIYMMSESQMYISNVALALSSRLGYPAACQHLRPNLPQSEVQITLSLYKYIHA